MRCVTCRSGWRTQPHKAARHKLARFVREHSHLPLEATWGSSPVVQLQIQVLLAPGCWSPRAQLCTLG